MKRSPLKRKTPMKRKRPKARKGPVKNPEHLAWIRTLPCSVYRLQEATCEKYGWHFVPICEGRIDPHHSTIGRGLGQKTDDAKAFPLCRKHHEELHNGSGLFRDKEKRRLWQQRMVELYKPIDEIL